MFCAIHVRIICVHVRNTQAWCRHLEEFVLSSLLSHHAHLQVPEYIIWTCSRGMVYITAANITVHYVCIFGTRYGDWGYNPITFGYKAECMPTDQLVLF